MTGYMVVGWNDQRFSRARTASGGAVPGPGEKGWTGAIRQAPQAGKRKQQDLFMYSHKTPLLRLSQKATPLGKRPHSATLGGLLEPTKCISPTGTYSSSRFLPSLSEKRAARVQNRKPDGSVPNVPLRARREQQPVDQEPERGQVHVVAVRAGKVPGEDEQQRAPANRRARHGKKRSVARAVLGLLRPTAASSAGWGRAAAGRAWVPLGAAPQRSPRPLQA